MFCHSAEKDANCHHAVLSSCQSQAGLQTWLLWPNWLWLHDWWGFQGETQKSVYIETSRMEMCVYWKPDRLNGVRHRRLVLELSTECAKTHYKHKVFIYLFRNLILFSFFKTIMIQFLMLAWFSGNMMFRGQYCPPMEHPKFNPCQAVARQPVYCQRKHAFPRPGTFWSPGYQIMDSHITTNNIYIGRYYTAYL